MPIGPFEREILRLLAVNRNPESFVGGATVMLQAADSPRQSEDIDVFHDTQASLQDAVARDMETLGEAGYTVEVTSRQVTFCRASVARGTDSTKLEWVYDSAFRFFPMTDVGCFYLDSAGRPVCPNPNSPDFVKFTKHFGCVKGAWPRIVDE